MNTPKHIPAIPLATFPVCSECGAHKVPPVADSPICVQVGNEPPVRIPRSQEAAALRFYWQIGAPVLWDHVYQAIGSHEVSRCHTRLRKKWGVPIPCCPHPKKTKPGSQGAYSVGPNVKVWEPEEEAGGHGAG